MKSNIKQLFIALYLPAALLIALPGNKAMAQKNPQRLNEKLEGLATGGSTRNWIDFRDGVTINPATVFEDHKEAFELSKDDAMKIANVQDDKLGFKHYRYQQYYKNHRVMYGEFIVHQNDKGIVKSANGRLITGINSLQGAPLNEEQALGSALNFVKAEKYLWQNSAMERELKRQSKDEKATYYPKGELVWVPAEKENRYDASAYRLAWKFEIRPDGGEVMAKAVYVDAATAAVVHYKDISMSCSGGTGTSAFNGSVSVNTLLSGGTYTSRNDCQATDIYVYNCGGGGPVNTLYSDADNTWTNQSATQAQWGAAMVYSYYNGQHARQSWDGSGSNMIAYNNAYAGQNNACWGCTGNSTIYYAGSTAASTDDWNTNDIMGHEFTHGVVQDEAGLVYSNESGALNESFADIFGEMVESWSEGNCDYLVGADRGAIRSFTNPNTFNDPDTYLGTNWYTGAADNGGVHTNSGVQNRWFHLLSEGGSGTNDLGKSYNVAGITRFKARDIAYRSLANYLTSSSEYIDARAGSLRAAIDLYGGCSAEAIAVGDAWHAVGVEGQSAQFVNDACGVIPSGGFLQAISVLMGNGCGSGNSIGAGGLITYYTARDRVILYPGFKATAGTRFIAYLEPCSSTMYRGNSTDNVIMSDAEKGIKTVPLTIAKTVNPGTEAIKEVVTVTPNPFNSNFTVSVTARQEGKARVTVYNSIGIKVQEKAGFTITNGLNKLTFNGAAMPAGMYLVEVVVGDVKSVKKIIKQ